MKEKGYTEYVYPANHIPKRMESKGRDSIPTLPGIDRLAKRSVIGVPPLADVTLFPARVILNGGSETQDWRSAHTPRHA